MTLVGFLPRRWRPTDDIARHAEAIAGILHTAPIEPTSAGPAIISPIGASDLLPCLVAVKSLRRSLGRGRIVVVDDGSLTGEDRAILAHHCGDPEILPHQSVPRGAFPTDAAWAMLLTVLDRRGGQYWIALDPHTVTLGPLLEIEQAIASNRSFSLPGGRSGIAGFAAGAGGRALATAFAAEVGEPRVAAEAAHFVLAREPETIELLARRYAEWRGRGRSSGPALIHFPPRHRYTGKCYAAASAGAIAALS